MFLGVDGGGTKTAYALIDADGTLRAEHLGPSVSYLAEGLTRAGQLLREGIGTVLSKASRGPGDLAFSFIGLPSYGEDSTVVSQLDALPSPLLPAGHYRCGNDMICSWAGSLGCSDGISVIAGTGSMAYGEYAGRNARAGGWGELIGDEGSAYWVAREGMNLFSRMSDGRAARGPLHELVRKCMGIQNDLDLCVHVYGEGAAKRNTFAQFAPLVHEAARAGDEQARGIFHRGSAELIRCVVATRGSLNVPDTATLPVSQTGGVFSGAELMVDAFRAALAAESLAFEYRTPLYSPVTGAALYAARLAGKPLPQTALQALRVT